MAAVQVAVATAANHFAALDDGSQEIYFTCTLHKMCSQIEILPNSWAETLPLFSIIEVRKRSKCDLSTFVLIRTALYILALSEFLELLKTPFPSQLVEDWLVWLFGILGWL